MHVNSDDTSEDIIFMVGGISISFIFLMKSSLLFMCCCVWPTSGAIMLLRWIGSVFEDFCHGLGYVFGHFCHGLGWYFHWGIRFLGYVFCFVGYIFAQIYEKMAFIQKSFLKFVQIDQIRISIQLCDRVRYVLLI